MAGGGIRPPRRPSPPTPSRRLEILRVHLRRTPLADGVSLPDLAARTEGYTGGF